MRCCRLLILLHIQLIFIHGNKTRQGLKASQSNFSLTSNISSSASSGQAPISKAFPSSGHLNPDKKSILPFQRPSQSNTRAKNKNVELPPIRVTIRPPVTNSKIKSNQTVSTSKSTTTKKPKKEQPPVTVKKTTLKTTMKTSKTIPTTVPTKKVSTVTTLKTTRKPTSTSRKPVTILPTTRESTTLMIPSNWPSEEPNYCNQDCWNNIKKEKKEGFTSASLCLKEEEYPMIHNPNRYCAIKKIDNETVTIIERAQLSSFRDSRIICRPKNDFMTWYRGNQSITVRRQACLRWDQLKHNFTVNDFDRHDTPSPEYTLRHRITSLSQHHDYCRNPDNHELGPWCYYKRDNEKLARNPCFETCIEPISSLCLSKKHFPFRLLHGMVGYETYIPYGLELIRKYEFKEHNELIDLTDLLDVPRLIQNVPQIMPIHKIGPLGIPYARGYTTGLLYSTRLKCHQSGKRTEIAGPWTPVRGTVPYMLTTLTRDQFRTFYYDSSITLGHSGLAEQLWMPCFKACEDQQLQCWPYHSAPDHNPDEPFSQLEYYGQTTTTMNNEECLPWYLVVENFIQRNTTDLKHKLIRNLLLNIYVYETPGTFNKFLEGQGYLLAKGICLDFGKLLEPDIHELRKIVRSAFDPDLINLVLTGGPSCVTSLKPFKYTPCFPQCSCPLKKIDSPSPVIVKFCGDNEVRECGKKELVEEAKEYIKDRIILKEIENVPDSEISFLTYTIPIAFCGLAIGVLALNIVFKGKNK